MKICTIGTGYVGLTAGACLSDMGNEVICADKDEKKISSLKKGIVEIYEPGLEELVLNNTKKNLLKFTTDIDYAVKNSQVCYIAVGTPQNADGSTDLSQVLEVVNQIAQAMNGYKLIVNKSTVPVGTADKMKQIIQKITNHPFDIVSNPEFLKQGNALQDFLYPDRIIIGTNSQRAKEIMNEIYATFIRTSNKIIYMDNKSAEMTKYCANAFLATKISFMNEMANLCEKNGANIENVRKGISSDERIGNKFLFSGIGFGGSCFPKDINALIKSGEDLGYEMKITKAVKETNDNQKQRFTDKILNYFKNDIKNKTFALWGLSFKPKTNDMREAPSISIINRLLENGAKIQAYDPKAMERAKIIFQNKIKYSKSSYEALKGADALLLLTEWNEFRLPDFDKIKSLLKTPLIFDGRNQYSPKELKKAGFEYYYIGMKN